MTNRFAYERVPVNDKVVLQKLDGALMQLDSTAELFASVIASFEATGRVQRSLPTLQERAAFWREHGHFGNAMAGRGATLICDFYRVQQIIQSSAAKNEWISVRTDRSKLKQSNQTFLARFPHFAKLRHSVAHHAETILADDFLDQSPSDNNVHGVEFGVPVLLAGTIVNGYYVWTRGNHHLSYELSLESGCVLSKCSSLFGEAFDSLRSTFC